MDANDGDVGPVQGEAPYVGCVIQVRDLSASDRERPVKSREAWCDIGHRSGVYHDLQELITMK